MSGDKNLAVEDLHQPAGHDRLDQLAGEGRPDPIAEPGQADMAALVRPAGHPCRFADRAGAASSSSSADLAGLGVDTPPGQSEPLHRRAVTQRLVGTVMVVAVHPPLQRLLGVRDGGEVVVVGGEELLAQRSVEPLDLAGSGRRVRRGRADA